jgi:hypothetical protein
VLKLRLLLLASVALSAGCGPAPHRPAQRALYNDLRAVVETRERIDWVIDRAELNDAAPRALRSVCRATSADRVALRGWLQAQRNAQGGTAEAVWRANGQDLDAVSELLTLERVSALLDIADARSAQDCPFWVVPDPAFAGVQGNTRRFVLMLESMGSLQVLSADGDTSIGGTGIARILPGVGLNDRLTLVSGIEAGVASTFPKGEGGQRGVKPAFATGIPVLLRIHEDTWRFDTEVAAVARAPEEDFGDLRWGVRVAQAAGVATLRVAGIMPYAMAWVGYEHYPEHGGGTRLHVMRFGTRVGVNWDP